MATSKDKRFNIQWHVTALCDQSCAHCYAKDERTHKQEIENPLSLDECERVIDSLVSFSEKVDARPNINFTGGDPLLREDFFDIANYAKESKVSMNILGNPYHLNDETISKMKDVGIRGYQISIDGMKEKHDHFRKAGSFDASIKALKELKKNKIRTVAMFTVSKYNAEDLIPVMNLVSDIEVDAFAFSRVCGFGNGKNLEALAPQEYRNLLLDAHKEEKVLKANGSKTLFNKKDHLWVPLLSELGEVSYEPTDDGIIYGGCSVGCNSFCILADGVVFACRRFYSPIGKVPEQSIEEIFISDELEKYRTANFEKCSPCDLVQYCRGCPAVAYGETGRFTAPDPQCWR